MNTVFVFVETTYYLKDNEKSHKAHIITDFKEHWHSIAH